MSFIGTRQLVRGGEPKWKPSATAKDVGALTGAVFDNMRRTVRASSVKMTFMKAGLSSSDGVPAVEAYAQGLQSNFVSKWPITDERCLTTLKSQCGRLVKLNRQLG